MNVIKIYEAKNCSTCKKALKFLLNHNYAVDRVDIFKTPPTKGELKKMIGYLGHFKFLFNTAGRIYHEMNLTEKIKTMTEEEALDMLAKNGRLVKRPFIFFKEGGMVGFEPKIWALKLK
ncbi:MAG: Spx/MgsR family RNA polymerase-binding regulatory protein [Proteobacteria bacterium]|nr:Spx/MgsR family RNA polymerase-binding regulatory protein [Pseudomonadota bacterium]NQW45537.1 Spx/MgsR family RNA polymerase-binding regulatory protein [Deltaproteobacteria bacterium]